MGLRTRLCHLERQAANRGPVPSANDQIAIARDKLLAEYLAAAAEAERMPWEPDTPEKERERQEVYEQLLDQARRR